MNRFFHFSLAVVSPFLLAQCAGDSEPSGPWLEQVHGLTGQTDPDTPLSTSELLKMTAPALQRSWGTPEVRVAKNGSYVLNYKDPKRAFERLEIFAYPTGLATPPQPPAKSVTAMVDDQLGEKLEPQAWKTVSLNLNGQSRSIKWFAEASGGGADGSYYSTEVFPVSVGERTTYFRLVIESVSGAAPARFSQVELAP